MSAIAESASVPALRRFQPRTLNRCCEEGPFLFGGGSSSLGECAPVLVAVNVVRPRCAAGAPRLTASSAPAWWAAVEEGRGVVRSSGPGVAGLVADQRERDPVGPVRHRAGDDPALLSASAQAVSVGFGGGVGEPEPEAEVDQGPAQLDAALAADRPVAALPG